MLPLSLLCLSLSACNFIHAPAAPTNTSACSQATPAASTSSVATTSSSTEGTQVSATPRTTATSSQTSAATTSSSVSPGTTQSTTRQASAASSTTTSGTGACTAASSSPSPSNEPPTELHEAAALEGCGSTGTISPDGSTAVIGGQPGPPQGTVNVLIKIGGAWSRVAQVVPPAPTPPSTGTPVAVSTGGTTLLVGEPNAGVGGQEAPVSAFTRSGNKWLEQAQLTEQPARSMALYGEGVALSGDGNTALVGSGGDGYASGTVFAYVRSGAQWTLQTRLQLSDASADASFGGGGRLSMSEDGSTAAIDALGAAYIFLRTPSGWTQGPALPADGGGGTELPSTAVSADGSTILVSVQGQYSGRPGWVEVFARSGSGWVLQGRLSASSSQEWNQFGYSVAVSGDGDTALVTEPTGSNGERGAYLFTRTDGVWSAATRLTTTKLNGIGSSVSLSSDGRTAVILDASGVGGIYSATASAATNPPVVDCHTVATG